MLIKGPGGLVYYKTLQDGGRSRDTVPLNKQFALVWFKKLNNTVLRQQNTVQYTIHLNNGVKLLVFPKLYTRCEENL